MSDQVSVTRAIRAPADDVFELVTDLERMGEWSPENEGGEWVAGSSGPEPGAVFRGANRRGWRRWRTTATVTEVDPGRRFAFRVSAFGLPVADWLYSIEPTPDGCTVTETWTDQRPGLFKPIAMLATGVSDRAGHNRRGMEQTLDRLAATAEGAA